MGLISKIKSLFQNRNDDIVRKFTTGMNFTGGPTPEFDVGGNNPLKYNAFWACCRVLAETVASVPVFEYKKDKSGDRKRTNDTGLYDILHYKYNDEMSAFNAKEMSMYQLNLDGNAVFTREYNRLGQIVSLTPHQYQNVKIDRNADTSKLQYTIRLSGNVTKVYSRGDVFHIAGPSLDGIIGMSPLEYAAGSIKLGSSYDRFSRNFYKNGVLSSGVFETDKALSDDAFDRLKEQLNKTYQGLHNTGKPIILEDSLTYKQISMKLADAELLSSKKFQVEDVARIFRMPLHLIQSLDHATNNNIEQQSLEFVMYTMLPHFKRQEEAINTQLLTKQQRDDGYYFEFNINALLRGDQKSMAEAFATGRQWGWLSVNDIRRLLNMNSIGPGGDIYLEPLNMKEAGTESEEAVVEGISNILEAYNAKTKK